MKKKRRATEESRTRVKRGVLGLLAAVFLAGTAGAYVPSRSMAERSTPSTSAARTEDDGTSADFDVVMAKLESRERELERELEELVPQLDLVQKRIVARGRQYYRLVRVGMLPVGGGFDGLVDHATRVERLRAALSRDMSADADMRARQVAAKKELRMVRAERAPLVIQREAMKQAHQVMQEADDRRDAFQRAFGSSSEPPHTAVYGADTGPIQADPSANFTQMKGRLSFPLAGRAVVTHTDKSVSMLQLRASRDTAVRAVYPGTVAFAGETDRGMTVVIDHGDHYFSTYGNLQNLDVKIGDALSERGRIGWIKRHGGKRPTLHFELRRGKAVLEPGTWLGL